ncbi:MAG: dienelactone hydrolase family protein [Planctomycetes bacterium]|nr:dienelactone hydrolase family protein [Planctomycetota bacterium]
MSCLIRLAVFCSMLVCLSVTMGFNALCQDVEWLPKVTTPPSSYALERPGTLAPLLVASDDGDSSSVDVHLRKISGWTPWLVQRELLREKWFEFLGPMPDPRPPVKLEVLSTETLLVARAESGNTPSADAPSQAITRQLVSYECEPGLWVEGYLLYPASAPQSISAFPAIVALHPTTNASIDEIAGVSGSESAKTGLKLVSRGYVVFCPRCFLWQNATSLDDAVSQHRKRHPNTKGMAKMLYDAMRAVDVLEAIPYVDRKRIGAIGHSLGAKEVLYLMAFDDRVRAGVASEGGIAFRSTNWNAPWYLSTAIDDEAFPLNHHQLLGMIAPRPFLVLGGESGPGAADGDRSWTLIEAALPVWRLSGKPIRLGLLNHHEGHKLSDASFEKMDEWMRCYLASEKPNPR